MNSSYDNLKNKYNNLVERYNLMCELLSEFDFDKNSKSDTKAFVNWLLYHVAVEMKKNKKVK